MVTPPAGYHDTLIMPFVYFGIQTKSLKGTRRCHNDTYCTMHVAQCTADAATANHIARSLAALGRMWAQNIRCAAAYSQYNNKNTARVLYFYTSLYKNTARALYNKNIHRSSVRTRQRGLRTRTRYVGLRVRTGSKLSYYSWRDVWWICLHLGNSYTRANGGS